MMLFWTGDGAKVIPRLDASRDIVGDVVLAPGWNQVADEEWMQARETAKPDIENGRIVEEWVKAEKSKAGAEPLISTELDGVLFVPAALKDINRPKVIDVVKATYHVPTLQNWLDAELRQDVRLEIYNRIDSITKHPKG
jgi:hypothetical protein